jgi:hypothetical protein
VKDPNDLSKEQLARIVGNIRDILARPDWDSETIEEVARILYDAGVLVATVDEAVRRRSE